MFQVFEANYCFRTHSDEFGRDPVGFEFIYFIFPSLGYSRLGGMVSDVATSHVQLIKTLLMSQDMDLHHYYFIKFCPYTRAAVAISVSASEPIRFIILRHLFDAAGAGGFTYASNPSGAPDGEETYVMKPVSCKYFCFLDASSLGKFLGENVEENKNESENKKALFLRHCWLELCSGWPPPRAILAVRISNSGWLVSTKESTRLEVNGPTELVVLAPAEGCLFLVSLSAVSFESFELLSTHVCDPRSPQGSRGTFGIRQDSANLPGAAQGPFGSFGVYSVHVCDSWAPRGRFGVHRIVIAVLVRRSRPWAPQVPRCPLGVLEVLLEALVVHRTVPGALQGLLGSPRGSHTQQPQWLARKGNLFDCYPGCLFVITRGEVGQPKKDHLKKGHGGRRLAAQHFRLSVLIDLAFQFQFRCLTTETGIHAVGNQQTEGVVVSLMV